MRKLLLGFLAACPFITGVCLAQANAINIYCGACRDPDRFPNDYANFAFNQIYGADSWLSPELADDFFVTNARGQRVYVDVDFVMTGFDFEGFRLPFWPRYLLQITMALPSGRVVSVLRSVFQTSLPVPSSPDVDPSDEPANDGGGTDGDEADEDYDFHYDEEFDWDYIEIDGNDGHTWIEDPDENGNFEEPEWCEEC